MNTEEPKKPETFDDLMRAILAILPNAQLEEDNYGQIVIYTDLTINDDGDEGGILEEFDPDGKV